MKTRYTWLFLPLLVVAAVAPPARYTTTSQSKVWVDGTSSIHDFTCTSTKFTGTFDTGSGAGSVAKLQSVQVTVPARSLACGNGQMDKKMYAALKADSHADIRYEMGSLSATSLGGNKYRLNTTGKLIIAGKEKQITMPVEAEELANGQIRFKGSTSFNMSDFGLARVSAALGTIKTGDKVTVGFDVYASTK